MQNRTADLSSNFSTLMALFLKEYRVRNNYHQASVAQFIGKNKSSFSKIESGDTNLSLDIAFGMCHALNLHPSFAINVVDKLGFVLSARGNYFFQSMELESDDLRPLVTEYFNSKGLNNIHPTNWIPIESLIYQYGSYVIPTAVRYITEPEYKNWLDEGAEGVPPLSLPSFSFQNNI